MKRVEGHGRYDLDADEAEAPLHARIPFEAFPPPPVFSTPFAAAAERCEEIETEHVSRSPVAPPPDRSAPLSLEADPLPASPHDSALGLQEEPMSAPEPIDALLAEDLLPDGALDASEEGDWAAIDPNDLTIAPEETLPEPWGKKVEGGSDLAPVLVDSTPKKDHAKKNGGPKRDVSFSFPQIVPEKKNGGMEGRATADIPPLQPERLSGRINMPPRKPGKVGSKRKRTKLRRNLKLLILGQCAAAGLLLAAVALPSPKGLFNDSTGDGSSTRLAVALSDLPRSVALETSDPSPEPPLLLPTLSALAPEIPLLGRKERPKGSGSTQKGKTPNF